MKILTRIGKRDCDNIVIRLRIDYVRETDLAAKMRPATQGVREASMNLTGWLEFFSAALATRFDQGGLPQNLGAVPLGGHRPAMAHELACLAFIARARNAPERSACLLGAAEALRELIEVPMLANTRLPKYKVTHNYPNYVFSPYTDSGYLS